MSSKPIIIATRGSALALAQARAVQSACRAAFPEAQFEICIIKTTGDKLQTASLAGADLPKGLFTKELEVALLDGHADMAVHSLKDLPTTLPDGCMLGAVGRREDPRDVLVLRQEGGGLRGFGPGVGFSDLPSAAVVATSSTRREAQVRELRPDLRIVPIRGNVGTRLRKLMENGELDATMLPAAGLNRLGFRIDASGGVHGDPGDAEPLPSGVLRALALDPAHFIPCVGQAAVGVEIRQNDSRVADLCRPLNDPSTSACVCAERSFLRAMGGGCQTAVAAHAVVTRDGLTMHGVSYLAGSPRRAQLEGSASHPEALGEALARELGKP